MNVKTVIENILNNNLVLLVLALDTVRAIIAATGIFGRNIPIISRLIYGKKDEDVVSEAFKMLGFHKNEIESIKKRIKKEAKGRSAFPKKDSSRRLTYILAKNTIEFENDISYGLISPEKQISYSKYYINTMDAVHNDNDLEELSLIMTRLIEKNINNCKPDFIIVPKGGNPLLAQNIARKLKLKLVIAKDKNDSARPPQDTEEMKIFSIRYEGIKELLYCNERKKYSGILIDCNTSGGTQLINIVKEFNNFIEKCNVPIEPISKAFVLFKLVKYDSNKIEVKIDKQFDDINCKLYRIYDLDEEDKKALKTMPTEEYYEVLEEIDELHDVIKKKGRYYF